MTTSTTEITQEARLAGAVWGHLVGDATGVPYEFGPPQDPEAVAFGARGTHGQPAGTWSDDGALMLALLDSLLERGFDTDDQGRRALAWYRDGAYTPDGDGRFDVGNATREALERIEAEVPAAAAGATHQWSKGNGSLMRILPLALVPHDVDDARLVELAGLASGVTHATVEARVTCGLYVLVVRRLVAGDAPEAALEAAWAAVERACDGLPDAAEALRGLRAHEGRTGGAYVFDAFWSAWDAMAGAPSYEAAIRRAIAYGGDTDTTAAIAGGLAGALWGFGAIPVAWRQGLRGRAIVAPLVDRLVEAATGARTSRRSPLRVDDVPLDGVPGLAGAPGRIGITFLPGKKRDGWTGRHWRDLNLDLARLREEGVDTLFLLNEDAELAWCLVPELPEVMAAGPGPRLLRHPLRDPRIPLDHARYRADIRGLADEVRVGRHVAVACRGGLDRSGMTVACLLVEAGLDPASAIERVRAHRRGSLTMPEQVDYVRAWPHA